MEPQTGFLEVSSGMAVESCGFHSDLSLPEADNGLRHWGRLLVFRKPSPEWVSQTHLISAVMPAGGSVHILGAKDEEDR